MFRFAHCLALCVGVGGAAVIINAPVPIGPLTNATTSPRPTLRVTNATHSGPAGAITYLFEVSTSSSFTTIIMSGTKTEGVNETGFIATSDLPIIQPLFWRATAKDSASNASSVPSSVQSFAARAFSAAETVAQQQLNQTL